MRQSKSDIAPRSALSCDAAAAPDAVLCVREALDEPRRTTGTFQVSVLLAKIAGIEVPSATLELFDVRHTAIVDGIEAGHPTGERVRIAVRVDDLGQAALEVTGVGAEALAHLHHAFYNLPPSRQRPSL